MNVTEKLGRYSKFPEEGNFIGQMCILRPFRVEEKRCAVHVLCKIVSHTTVEPPLFPGGLLAFKFHWQRRKVKYDFLRA